MSKRKRPHLTADQLAAELERRRALQEPDEQLEDDSADSFDGELPYWLGLYEDEHEGELQ